MGRLPVRAPHIDGQVLVGLQSRDGDVVKAGQALAVAQTPSGPVVWTSPWPGVVEGWKAPVGDAVRPGQAVGSLWVGSEWDSWVMGPDSAPAPEVIARCVPVFQPGGSEAPYIGAVVEWMVFPGDLVDVAEVLTEIDGPTWRVPVEAPVRGVVRQRCVGVGEDTQAATVLLWIEPLASPEKPKDTKGE